MCACLFAELECLLGELQAAFLACLLGQDFDAFEQWKRLFGVLCACDRAPDAYPRLYLDFLVVVRAHLAQLPMDWFTDLISGNTFLAQCLSTLMQVIGDGDDDRLRREAEKLAAFVKQRFDWDVFVNDEDAPEVVHEDDPTL